MGERLQDNTTQVQLATHVAAFVHGQKSITAPPTPPGLFCPDCVSENYLGNLQKLQSYAGQPPSSSSLIRLLTQEEPKNWPCLRPSWWCRRGAGVGEPLLEPQQWGSWSLPWVIRWLVCPTPAPQLQPAHWPPWTLAPGRDLCLPSEGAHVTFLCLWWCWRSLTGFWECHAGVCDLVPRLAYLVGN